MAKLLPDPVTSRIENCFIPPLLCTLTWHLKFLYVNRIHRFSLQLRILQQERCNSIFDREFEIFQHPRGRAQNRHIGPVPIFVPFFIKYADDTSRRSKQKKIPTEKGCPTCDWKRCGVAHIVSGAAKGDIKSRARSPFEVRAFEW